MSDIHFSLENINLELQKNLVYSLERRFPSATFQILSSQNDSKIKRLLVQDTQTNETQLSQEIENFISLFKKKSGTLGTRVQSSILWKNSLEPLPNLETSFVLKGLAYKSDLPGVF